LFSICVFCGSRTGTREDYLLAAEAFGRELAMRNIALVYGGGRVGLMGAVADAALAGGGHVIGVIPEFLREREVAHESLSECIVVDDLFERKSLMIERSDAFVALPGGIGTLDEILEVIAWRQLRQLGQTIGLLNVAGFFDRWFELLEHLTEEGFVGEEELAHIIVRSQPCLLLDALMESSST
jgi:uncharacterized protein (TIGR00730 family)